MKDFLMKKWVVFLIAIPFFFCLNRYLGIRVDGVLYTLQVIHRWFPERFVGDPPFMFGNQDEFTIFSSVYGFLIQHLPIDMAAMLITFIIQFLFASAIILFIRAIAQKFDFEHWTLPLSLIFFVLYISTSAKSTIYFSQLVEPYPVPRTLAISFAILGLATFFNKNKWITLIFSMIGSAFHPLMAGWLLPIWLFYHFPKTKFPIIAISALFPLLGYIGLVPFAAFPEGWYYRPLTYGPCVDYVLRFFIYIAFFIFFLHRSNEKSLKNLSSALLIVTSIALYWYIWTGINNFILLYQFQVWRMEWLCVVVIFPLFAILVREVWVDYKKTHILTTKSVSPFLFGLTLFSDIHSLDGIALAMILLFLPTKKIDARIISGLALYYPLLNLLVSGIQYMILLGFPCPNVISYSFLGLLRNRFTFLTAVICVAFGIYALRKHELLRSLFFFVSLFLPHFFILPIVAILWPYLKKWQKMTLLIIAVLDGIWGNTSIRNATILLSFLERIQLLFTMIVSICFLAAYFFSRKRKNIIAKIFVLLPILFTIPYAMQNWDNRKEVQKIEESNVDQFKWQTVFPQITERGKIFYYVNGDMCTDPRLRFLTGGYIDTKSTIGEIFKEEHHKTAVGRLNSLIYKNKNVNLFTGVAMRDQIVYSFFEDSLTFSSILIDRVNFLCGTGEITHLVSDFDDLSYVKQDSIRMNVMNTEIYLYKCPSSLDIRRD